MTHSPAPRQLTVAEARRYPPAMPLEHRFVHANGVRLHCVVAGDGPLVVLLHGFPEYWYSWRHQIEALATRFRVVAVDMRGYNESEKPVGLRHYTLDTLVADVEGVVHAFGETEAVIVGHDWGAIVAWAVAMERPALTRRLVIMNVPHPAIGQERMTRDRRQMRKSWYVLFFQIPRFPEWMLSRSRAKAIGRMFQRTAIQAHRFTNEDLENLRDAAARPGAMRSALCYYRALIRSPRPWR